MQLLKNCLPLAITLGACPCFADKPEPDAKTVRARGLLTLLTRGEFTEFVAAADEKVKAAFSPQQAEQAWTGITAKVGPYRSEESATYAKVPGAHVVRFVCRFERGKATLRIVLDDADRLSGLWFDAVEPDAPYQPPTYADPKAYREQKITVSAGQFPLPGTLTLPTRPGPHPAVLLVHGSGPHDQDETIAANKPFRDLAFGLASRGVAVLRYEKRTHKYPTAVKPEEWTLETETIEDAVAAAELLRKQADIDPKRVFLAGHSLGAFVAPFIARRDPKLAGIALLAGNARSILDLIDEQTEYLAGLDGSISDDDQKRLRNLREATALIRQGKTEGLTEKVGMPAAYLARMHTLKPIEAAAELNTPILIAQGGRDYQVTRTDFDLWKKALGTHKNVTFRLYDKLNHLFIPGSGPSTPAEYGKAGHVDVQVVEDLAAWIETIAPDRSQTQ
ncbi:MAG TPA: alpha/beta fold hydrolase [Phycisphaerae bacterium]|nr:alpha/beta fold hydrolase [Phycisphaerae bacterium]HRY68456.1 alpha/beta fold hydrolase [Phycisphaerae bacterium]HSA28508.1 alpha/beta fold hydrolase [Phycisphaerae bacterium]